MKWIQLIIYLLAVYCYGQKNVPELTFKTLKGETISLHEYSQNEYLVLNFWATWCEPCIEELNELNELSELLNSDLNTRLIAISIDDSRTISRVRSMESGFDWKFDIVLDKNQEIKRALNFISIPYTLIIYKSEIVYEKSGYVKGDEQVLLDKLTQFQKNPS